MRFVDTNVLLYAISGDRAEQGKARVAQDLLAADDLGLSVQVLQEFFVQATRAGRPDPLKVDQAIRLVESFTRFPVQPMTAGLALAAMETSRRYVVSYWDAAIIEAARRLGCEQVLSENLNHGQDYAGVRVHNPFA